MMYVGIHDSQFQKKNNLLSLINISNTLETSYTCILIDINIKKLLLIKENIIGSHLIKL